MFLFGIQSDCFKTASTSQLVPFTLLRLSLENHGGTSCGFPSESGNISRQRVLDIHGDCQRKHQQPACLFEGNHKLL